MKTKFLVIFLAFFVISISAFAANTPATTHEKVFIIEPIDGATVPTTFTVKFGESGVDIVPAGINKPHSGHYHLLIDTNVLPDLNSPLPASPTLIHFGKAQTETKITLAPGKHTLQLLLGNYIHIAGTPPIISKKITITVK